MTELTKSVQTRGVVVSAEASFTQDMAQNLVSIFAHLHDGQEVTCKDFQTRAFGPLPQMAYASSSALHKHSR